MSTTPPAGNDPVSFKALLPVLKAAKIREMTEEETKIMYSLLRAEHSGVPIPKEAAQDFTFRVAKKRVAHLTTAFTNECLLFFALKCGGRLGELNLYLHYLNHRARATNMGKITMNNLALFFPLGFWTEAEAERLWDLQKVGGKNLVDGDFC